MREKENDLYYSSQKGIFITFLFATTSSLSSVTEQRPVNLQIYVKLSTPNFIFI